MKNNKKMALVITLTAVIASVVSVSANNLITKVQAEINKGITVSYNGQLAPLKDAKGNTVYAMSYNGSTYLPVRAVAGIFGEDVNWDDATQTVILGSVEKQPVRLRDIITAGDKGGLIMDKNQLSVVGADGTANFEHGVYFDIWNGSGSTGTKNQPTFDVTQYDTLTFTAYSTIDCKFGLFTGTTDDALSTQDLKANTLTTIEWDVSGFEGIVGIGADSSLVGEKGKFFAFDAMIK